MKSAAAKQKYFFSGVGGSGMSALAAFFAAAGNTVVGSDRDWDQAANMKTFQALEAAGVTMVPQDGKALDSSYSRVIFSTAVESKNPDAIRAKEIGLPCLTRPQILSELINNHRSVAIAGTSGKSSVSGWIAWVMQQIGLDPCFIGGARVRQFHTRNRLGNMLAGESDLLVAEACESDKSIVHFKPRTSVLLNVSKDHHDVSETLDLFQTLCNQTADQVIINADDHPLGTLSASRMLRFGTLKGSDIRALNIQLDPLSSSFEVEGISFRLRIPGLHNVYNALATIAVLWSYGIDLERIVEPLETFQGVERRFEIHLNEGGRLVIDDYAHNPDKIRALMSTIARITPSACYVFQPHGFGPTRFLKEAYIETFRQGLRREDRLFILPIYYAGGTVARDISSQDLVSPLASAGLNVELLPERGMLVQTLDRVSAVVIFGARDESLSELAKAAASHLRSRA